MSEPPNRPPDAERLSAWDSRSGDAAVPGGDREEGTVPAELADHPPYRILEPRRPAPAWGWSVLWFLLVLLLLLLPGSLTVSLRTRGLTGEQEQVAGNNGNQPQPEPDRKQPPDEPHDPTRRADVAVQPGQPNAADRPAGQKQSSPQGDPQQQVPAHPTDKEPPKVEKAPATLPGGESRQVTYLDLGPQVNQKLTASDGTKGNNLGTLPTGVQTFAGVKFKIGAGLIQLSGKDTTSPVISLAARIKVNTTLSRLSILHATRNNGAEDSLIAYYIVNYDDKSQETIPIVYGKDVLGWWYSSGSKEPTRPKVAWKGDNDVARDNGCRIRLYLTTWKNPKPARQVVSIDFVSTASEPAAPFCVAMTAEE